MSFNATKLLLLILIMNFVGLLAQDDIKLTKNNMDMKPSKLSNCTLDKVKEVEKKRKVYVGSREARMELPENKDCPVDHFHIYNLRTRTLQTNFTKNGAVYVRDLQPDTYYHLVLKFEDLYDFSWKFTTKPVEPLPVRNLKVVSKNDSSISIRWQRPNPNNKTGTLELYSIFAYNTKSLSHLIINDISIRDLKTCSLWKNLYCHTITNLTHNSSNHMYTIEVHAKNFNVSTRSIRLVTTTARQEASTPPQYLRARLRQTWVFTWVHPDAINGPITAFRIDLAVKISELENGCQYTYTGFYNITKYTKEYKYQIPMDIPNSTSYKLTVRAINEFVGEPASIVFSTPPEVPYLTGNISVVTTSDTTLSIRIPKANTSTISKNSFIYVIVEEQGYSIKYQYTCNARIILQLQDPMNWIAAELKPPNKSILYTIGTNSTIYSRRLREHFIDQELKPYTEYKIVIILLTHYNNRNMCTFYHMDTVRTNLLSLTKLLALCMSGVLVLIVCTFLLYRFFYKKTYKMSKGKLRCEDNFTSPMFKMSKLHSIIYYSKNVSLESFESYVENAFQKGDLAEQHTLVTEKIKKVKGNYNCAEKIKPVNMEDTRCRVKYRLDATYIKGYNQNNAYLITQGPKADTENDFWMLIWLERVKFIVMLSNIPQGDTKKCDQYWSSNGCQVYGCIAVRLLDTEILADVEHRVFDITYKGIVRRVEQYQYTSWPDHGVPHPHCLVTLMKTLQNLPMEESPILIHGRADKRRTGIIILCHICLKMAKKEELIDLWYHLHELRDQYPTMIDNLHLYIYAHLVLAECFRQSPEFSCNILKTTVNDLSENWYQTQFDNLKETDWIEEVFLISTGIEMKPENCFKNRFADIFPEKSRIILPKYPTEDLSSDYINAVPINGFKLKDQFIVTQLPLPNTLDDFWRMIDHQKSTTIVCLNDIPLKDKTCCQCWPDYESTMELKCGISLTHISNNSKLNHSYHGTYDVFNIQLNNRTQGKQFNVSIIQYKDWKYDRIVPNNSEHFVDFCEKVAYLSRGKCPITVMCYNGNDACGIFVGLSYIIEKMKFEQICDINFAIRVIRRNRKQFITNQVQLKFLYTSAVKYLQTFEEYSNFK